MLWNTNVIFRGYLRCIKQKLAPSFTNSGALEGSTTDKSKKTRTAYL